MESTLEYLANMYPVLGNDYRTPDGKHSNSCCHIAVEIAKRLIFEGKSPYIIGIEGEELGNGNREVIVPKRYNGRIEWGAHQVCCEGILAYDPMVDSKPVLLLDYCEIAFKDKSDFEILVPSEKIVEFVHR